MPTEYYENSLTFKEILILKTSPPSVQALCLLLSFKRVKMYGAKLRRTPKKHHTFFRSFIRQRIQERDVNLQVCVCYSSNVIHLASRHYYKELLQRYRTTFS